MKVLTPKLLDDLSSLAALGWTDAELARFLDITERQLADILADPTPTDNPNIRELYDHIQKYNEQYAKEEE